MLMYGNLSRRKRKKDMERRKTKKDVGSPLTHVMHTMRGYEGYVGDPAHPTCHCSAASYG